MTSGCYYRSAVFFVSGRNTISLFAQIPHSEATSTKRVPKLLTLKYVYNILVLYYYILLYYYRGTL
jgi:hypothetical protein